MPTILLMKGWRLYFFADEGNEPVHVHAEKGDMECKFWIKAEEFEIELAYEYGLTPSERKEIRKIIFAHFDFIVEEWARFFKK